LSLGNHKRILTPWIMSVCPLRGANVILGRSVLESRAIPRLEPSITVEDAIRPGGVPQNGTSNGSTGWERQWHPPERARSGWAPRVRQVLSAYGRHERRRRTGRVAGRTGRIVPFGSRHDPDEHRDRGGIACAHSQGRRPHGRSAPSLDRNPVAG